MREHLHHFKKVGTIAVLVDSPDDEWVRVGFSILHEGDQFNRKLGRVIAVGRAQAQREHLAAASTQEHIRDLIQTLREWEALDLNPQVLKDEIRDWLED